MKKTILSSAAAILLTIGLSPAIALAGGQYGGKPQSTVTTTTTTVTRTETVPLHPRYLALHRAHSRYDGKREHQGKRKHHHQQRSQSRDRHARGRYVSPEPQVVYREPERHQHRPVGHREPRNDGRLSVRIGYEIRL